MTNGMVAESEVLTSEQVLLALERILKSSMFMKSNRLSRFLRFAVELTLEGKAVELKEYTIATKVYHRREDFDPAQDTIVRSEARRLRRKLKEYYDTEGKGDTVIITLPLGSYVPVHRVRSILPEVANPEEAISVTVEPFECDAGNALAWECAFGISDEILHHLTHFEGIHIRCGSVRGSARDRCMSEEAVHGVRAGVVIQGTVRAYDNLLRITARATTADGRLLWSHRIDTVVEDIDLINLQEKVAADVLTRIRPLFDLHRPENTPKNVAALLLGSESFSLSPWS